MALWSFRGQCGDRSPAAGPSLSEVMTSRNVLRAGLVAAAALTLAGCGVERTGAPSPTSFNTTTTSAEPTTTTPAAPATAADGTNYGVCANRGCEVAVSGPVDIRFGGMVPGMLSITKVAPDGVDVNVTMDDGGGGNGTLKPGCSAFSFGGGGGGSGSFGGPASNCSQAPEAVPGSVTLQMPALTDGTAIMRIVTA